MDAQLEGFLNTLGEAERAGGRVLHELTAEARSLGHQSKPTGWAVLGRWQRH